MSRTPMIAGNWKMNTLRSEAITLARDICARVNTVDSVETVLCPPFPYLHDVSEAIRGTRLMAGAQNVFWEEKGAYTGEVSVTQIAELAQYAIIGHSERRQYFGETDETVNKRVKAALAHGLKPIMCVGETLDQRNAAQTADVLAAQTRGGLDGVKVTPEFVIAYEPVWAIGTGLAANGEAAEEAIAGIRATVRQIVGDAADGVRILYGGSVTKDNIAEFMAQPDIDGALVGGASLNAEGFAMIVQATTAAVRTGS